MPSLKKIRSAEVEEKNRRKKPARQEEGKVMEAPGSEMALPSSMAGGPVALLTSPQMAHPANAPLRAKVMTKLQRQRGNVYVQQLMERVRAEKGSGRPLEPKVRAEMEAAFGHDFGDVQVHTDAAADRLARELRARAFTSGKDIFFGKGQYSSTSNSGKGLLGHELAHVIQQEGETGYSAVQDGVSLVGKPGDAFEREAEAAGQAVVSSALATVQRALHVPSVQKQEAEEEAEVPYIELPPVVILTKEEIKSAIKYNKARHSVERIKIIQRTVGTKDDGIMGQNTVQAIADWQAQKGLVPDGKVGPKTLAKIYKEIPKEQAKRLEKEEKPPGKERPGREKAYIVKKSGVVVTPEIQKVLDELEDYFRREDLRVTVTSAVRTPESQLRIIVRKAKQYGLHKKYPSILTATVDDIESWRGAWDELLNIKGFIVNPPKPAKCKLPPRKGRTIRPSPHVRKKAFDLARASLDSIKAIVNNYWKEHPGTVSQVLVERKNKCVHVGIK